jgi:hypothetical protein
MGSLRIQDLQALDCKLPDYSIFVESGTYQGSTILHMEPYFSKLYTIEIREVLCDYVKQYYCGDKIAFYMGDSAERMNEVAPDVQGPAIYFLDAHYSSGITGRGEKDCPLYEELQSIALLHRDKAIVIVNDVRLFGELIVNESGCEDWQDINIESVVAIVKERLDKLYFLPSAMDRKDRLVLHLSKRSF